MYGDGIFHELLIVVVRENPGNVERKPITSDEHVCPRTRGNRQSRTVIGRTRRLRPRRVHVITSRRSARSIPEKGRKKQTIVFVVIIFIRPRAFLWTSSGRTPSARVVEPIYRTHDRSRTRHVGKKISEQTTSMSYRRHALNELPWRDCRRSISCSHDVGTFLCYVLARMT